MLFLSKPPRVSRRRDGALLGEGFRRKQEVNILFNALEMNAAEARRRCCSCDAIDLIIGQEEAVRCHTSLAILTRPTIDIATPFTADGGPRRHVAAPPASSRGANGYRAKSNTEM